MKNKITTVADDVLLLPKGRIKKIQQDVVKTAEAVNLIYVSGSEPGITRVRHGNGFTYQAGNKRVKDREELNRIRGLVIPPAWEEVWICSASNGHLQATGIDARKRKQYRYHPEWSKVRNQTKFYHIYEFGKALPAIREQLKKDLALPGLPAEKVLAAIVSLMERTHIRIGSNLYEKLYGSFGLTTLKDKHVSFNGNSLLFSFRGKKGVEHTIALKSKKLLNIVKQCRDIPGKELFQFYNKDGERKTIDSGMVNEYIRRISGGDFTAKDFRTWAGTVHFLSALKEVGPVENPETKIPTLFKMVSKELGNTPTVCKKYYVHPLVVDMYQQKKLGNQMDTPDDKEINGLNGEERLIMKIMETH